MRIKFVQAAKRFSLIRRLLLLVFVMVALFWYGHPLIGSDGVAHYALTESLVKDRDFDLGNQRYLSVLAPQGFNDYRSIGGRICSYYSGGVAVLNAPFLYTALQFQAVLAPYQVLSSSSTGIYSPARPGFLPEFSILLASTCFYLLSILATVAILQRRAEEECESQKACNFDPYLLAIAVSLGLPLFYYSFSEPSFPHAADTLIVTLGFWAFTFRDRLRLRAFDLGTPLLGFLLGFAVFIRNINLALVAPYVGYLLLEKTRAERAFSASAVKQVGQTLLKLTAGAVPSVLMIGAYNSYCYGSMTRFGYAITAPELIVPLAIGSVGEIGKLSVLYLFHPVRGLFIWSPITILAVLSAYQNRRRLLSDDRLFVSTLCPLLAVLGLSLWRVWTAGIAFGPRFATMLFPFFAYLIWELRWPVRRTAVALLTGAAYSFILLHFYLLAQSTPSGNEILLRKNARYTPLDLVASGVHDLTVRRDLPLARILPDLTLLKSPQAQAGQRYYPITQTTHHNIGTLQPAGEGKQVLHGRRGEVGFLLYGPYDRLDPGRYVGHFALQIMPERDLAKTVVATLDVAAWPYGLTGMKQMKQIASASLRGKDFSPAGAYKTFDLEFTLDQPSFVELRVYSPGVTDLKVLETQVESQVHPPILYRVNGQTPSGVGHLLSDGQSHYLVAEQGEVGYLLYGVKMPLAAGDFQAAVRLRADRSAPEEVAVIDLHAIDPSTRVEPFLAPSTNLVLTRLSIRGTDFTRPGQFQDFPLRFSTRGLASTMLYELRVQSSGQSGLWVEQTAIQQME